MLVYMDIQMQFYYDNFINFVTSLYEFGNLIDPNFGEKLVQNSIKNKFK